MNDVLIIGYGNTLRGDDGAGIRAAERLRDSGANLDVVTVHELQPELIDAIARRSLVVFIDGSLNVDNLHRREIFPSTSSVPSQSHHLVPEQLLALSRMIHGTAPASAIVFEIPIHTTGFGESLSPQTEQAVNDCVRAVEELLASL